MIYKFRTISTENKAFLRDYEIDSEALFSDFNNLIENDLGFDSNLLVSFFLADEEWNKGLELTRLDMNNDEGPVAVPMDTVRIVDLVNSRKSRLLYVYDIFNDQHLFIELIDMYEAKKGITYPRCCASVGEAPIQLATDTIDFSGSDLDDELKEFGSFGEDDEFDDELGDVLSDEELY